MPLAGAFNDMKQAILSFDLSPGFHAGNEWAKVAEAYFQNGTNPVWADLSAGKTQFAATMGPEIPSDPMPAAAIIFANAWAAFAGTCVASCAPGLPGFIPPIAPPPNPPTFTWTEAADTVDAQVTQLLADLTTWVNAGTVAIPPPGPGSPIPTPPWT